MFRLGADLKVYLHREPIDFRAGINRWSGCRPPRRHRNVPK